MSAAGGLGAAQGPQKPTEFKHPEMHSEQSRGVFILAIQPFLTVKYQTFGIFYTTNSKVFDKNHNLTWAWD